MIRLFVALELPEDVRGRLAALGGGVPGARWLRPEQMHITLRFIGEVDGARFEDIRIGLGEISAPPLSLAITGVGLFGKLRQPRVLWAGITPDEPVIALHDKIEHRLIDCGLAPEGRKFKPHVTLARLKNAKAAKVESFLQSHDGLYIPGIEVTRFALFSSFLSASGAIYRIEESYPLSEARAKLTGRGG